MVELDDLSPEEKIEHLKKLKEEIKSKKETLKKEEELEIQREKEIEDLLKKTQLDLQLALERKLREELSEGEDDENEFKLEDLVGKESVVKKKGKNDDFSLVDYKTENDNEYKSSLSENYSPKKTYGVNDFNELINYNG